MNVIDMKKWQSKRHKDKARGPKSYKHYRQKLFCKIGAVIGIGFVLSFLVPVILSVLVALAIVAYGRDYLANSHRNYRR